MSFIPSILRPIAPVTGIALIITLISPMTNSFAVGYSAGTGAVSCGTSGYFTVGSYVVTGNTSCVGTVVIPEGVTSINDPGFYLAHITSVSLPSTLTTIGSSAFRVTDLTSVVIPANVTTIGAIGFASIGINSLTFENGSKLTTIADYAFQSTSFSTITIPAAVTSIGDLAFQLNASLTSILENLRRSEEPDLILQLDNECAEFSELQRISETGLKRFRIVVVEFNGLERAISQEFFKSVISEIFKKLLRNFNAVYSHTNNCCGALTIHGVAGPRIMEINFHSVSPRSGTCKEPRIPHKLDVPKIPNKRDLDWFAKSV